MMARGLMVEGGGGEVGMVASNSGTLFLLCMVVMYLSILSMVIFACGLRGGGGGSGHGRGHRDDGVDFRGGVVKGEGGDCGGGDLGGHLQIDKW